MLKAPVIANDEKRSIIARRYLALTPSVERSLKEVTNLIRKICGTKYAMVTLLEGENQWIISPSGIDIKHSDRDISFCGHAIEGKELFIINDATKDERFFDNPFVTEDPNIKFYAGAPLEIKSGERLGALCVIDDSEKELTEEQQEALRVLSKQVIQTFEMVIKNNIIKESYQIEEVNNRLIKIAGSHTSLEDKLERALKEILTIEWLSLKSEGAILLKNKNDQNLLTLKASYNFEKHQIDEDMKSSKFNLETITKKESEQSICYHLPIRGQDKTHGVLVAYLKKDEQSIDKHVHILSTTINSIGQLIDYSLLTEKLNEQRRINFHKSKLAGLGELAAGVGHEINNPLAIIKGYVSSIKRLLEAKDDPRTKEKIEDKVDKVLLSVDRIAKIVKGLRTFGRVDENEVKENFSIKLLLEETLELSQDILNEAKLDVSVNIEDADYIHFGNAGRLGQVLINLISNAKDAVKENKVGNKNVQIHLSRNENHATFKISDNGHGISQENLDKIFDPFFTTKELNQGTGIGLSISHEIIAEHGGEFHVDSTEGEGTTFSFTIPVKAQNIETIESVAGTEYSSNFKGKTILICDDEDDILDYLKFFFEELEFTVYSASNGREAHEFLGENIEKIDLIVSDMKMPHMSGIELIKKIKQMSENPPPFIAITGGVNLPVEEIEALYGVIPKPFEDDEIIQVVKDALFNNLKNAS
jgi:C4-dicarboxylate-specific signal transduction histidine kinase